MMENGVEVFDAARLGEKKGAEDEIVEPRVEDKSVVGLDVAKESEGEEVFEEAIEPETPGAGIEDEAVNEGRNDDNFGSVASYMEENANLDSKDEDEMFEEAVETSLETQQTDDESREKTDTEPSVEEQGASEKLDKDEAQWVDKNSIVENGKDEVTEIADLDASVEIETLVDRTERDRKSGELLEMSENGVSDHLSFGENQTHHDALETNHDQQDGEVHGIIGTPDASEAKGGINDVQKQVHSYKDALLQDEKNVEVIETSDIQPAGHQDLLDVHKDVSVSSGPVLKDETDIELHIVHSSHLGLVNSDVEDNKQKYLPFNDTSTNGHHGETLNPSDEKENAVLSEEATNGNNKNEEQVDGPIYAAASTPQGGSTHLNMDAKERAFTSPEPVCQEHMEELKDIVSGHATDHQGEDSPTVGQVNLNGKIQEHEGQKEVLSSDATDHQGLQGKESPALGPDNLNDKADAQQGVSLSGTSASENHRESSVGRTTTAEDEESKSSEGLISDNVEKVYVSLPESVSESSNVSQLPVVDASVGVNKVVVEESEKCTIIEELKQNVHRVREPEVRSARDIPSSSGASTTRTTTPARPAGLGRAAPLLEPAPRMVQHPRVNGTTSSVQNQLVEEPTNGESEEYDETREKLQMIRVKFLRLAHRLGQTPHNVVVAQVLYRLGLAEQLRGRNGGRVAAFSFDRASAMAEQLEAAGQEALDFSCTIMVLGKTGVGKSATVNSIFDEVKFGTDAFQTGTKKVQDVVGTVQGIKVRIIDTPGLLPSWSDQRQNEKILHSVKRFIKKSPPDIVLYLDRLDVQSRDYGDMPLLRTITEVFGPSIWFNAIVVLTHAASAPPEGANGTATSYDMFVTQRSHVVQQAIRQTAGDMRLMNPVSLVENHSACRTNRAGQRVLPNGQVWKPHLLLLSFASKILAEANTLLKLQDSPPGRPYATRTRSPPLPFLLSSLLQSRPQVKLPAEQFGDEDEPLDDDLDESSDSEDESEYDQLPPFKRLTKVQLAKLTKDQKKAYNDELEYREKLFVKKQLKEERKRRRMMKKMQAAAKELPTDLGENVEEETGGAASVPVPMPDFSLPSSFDSDNPTHRYRYLDSSNQWLVRPVLEPNGWDHDVGYEGINVEKLFVVKDKIPISFSSQVSKDKKDANLQMELASSLKHGNGKATSLGFDMQSVGKDLAYTLRSETRFSNYRKNKATVGLSATLLGDVMTGGMKLEDKLMVNNRGLLVVSGGAMFGRGDVAYGGSLEATLRDKDHPLGRFLSTLGISVMDWHGDLAIGCNSQTQIPIGRYTNLIGRVNINNKGSGQVSIRLNSSEQLQIALISLVPLVQKLLSYFQPVQYG